MGRYVIFLLLPVTAVAVFVMHSLYELSKPVKITEDTTLIIKAGQRTSEIATQFIDQGIISHSFGFFAGAIILKVKNKNLQHGEYLVQPQQSLWEILQKISNGKVVVHYLTIPEGLTVYEISKKLENIDILTGTIEKLPPEGILLPETYDYYYGDSRQNIMQRMEKSMEKLKSSTWDKYQNDSFLKSWNEVLILASIVEKETAVNNERSLVASVYLNRLKINMPLQADPTVIYAATNGQTSFYRPILKSDLALQSPFNTYLQKGLPPTPIACPGEASIMAVLKPASTSYLYFVANGTGGHEFSSDLKSHNQNVRNWRIVEKQKKANA